VDIVVRGEGELTIVDLASALSNGGSLISVDGITFKKEGRIVNNPAGRLFDLDSFPVDLPYDLLELGRYPQLRAGRLHLQTSRGCPSKCGFCYNSIFSERRWRGKSSKRVLDEIEYLLEKFPNVKTLDPVDDNFFVDKKRVEEICQGMIDRGINVSWRANCRFDYFANYDERFVRLLEKAGCVELDFGGESGSTTIQTLVDKEVTHQQMVQSVENLRLWAPNIEPYVSWLSGLPNENEKDLDKTFDLMDRMTHANPKTQHYAIFVYTPFPSPLMNTLPPEFIQPAYLEAWGDIDVFHFDPPWHSKQYVKKLHAISTVTRYVFYPKARIQEHGFSYKIGYALLNRTARFRWRKRYFGFPLELRAVDYMTRKLRGFL
jgi:anaerobic magnesium-protoporphyrin IX monomethyl ester cyclase